MKLSHQSKLQVCSALELKTTLTKKFTHQRLNKKTGLNTYKEAYTKPWKRWKMQRFDVGTKTHKRMKWRLALRIANLPSERWLVKAADWNPEFSSKYKTNGAIGRPRRRWEDDINEFLKLEKNEVENSIEGDNKYNKSWIKAAKDSGRWTLLENDCTMNAEERSEGNARLRRNTQSRPARCVNGVRLRDGSHNTKSKRRSK